jgi:putative salt-induced outer membrane protein YdiY
MSAACIFIFPVSSAADEVVMANGDRLTGTVVRAAEGTLILKTGYSEPVKIEVSKIKSISTDSPVEVHMAGGEVLRGRLATLEGSVVVRPSDDRGETAIAWASVKAINPPRKWTGSVTVGANMQSGNTDRLSASLAAHAVRRTEVDRFSMRFLYNYAEEEDELTERNAYGALKYDYFFTRRFYGLLSVELFSDEFKDISLRTAVGPGVGYQVWEEERRTLMLEAGLAYFNEDRSEGEDESWITGRLSADLTLRLLSWAVFSDYLIVYPSLKETGQYQLRNEAGLSNSLGAHWSLKLTNILEYDSQPEPGIEKTDLSWILGLQYSF